MKTRGIHAALCGLMLGACTFEAGDGVDATNQPIIRGQEEERFPQAVFLHMVRTNGASALCTGSYVAPRVVVTAAHCILPDVDANGFFVYHGDDYHADVALLPNVPAPGQPSVWARAETWEQHPDYDPVFNYPDFAVAYLDRELPFAPLPLARFPIGRRWVGEQAITVGWGADRALTPDLSVVEGVGVKRSGRQTILGSPTEADFFPEDPNPGILFPEIREDLLKLDGRAPGPNTCLGDSGGPLIVKRHGRRFAAAINFWTGLSCEDYAMHTRVEPFLDYFDAAFDRAGGAPIVPRLECVAENPGGTFTAYFGYRNDNGLSVEIPFSRSRNSFPQDVDGERPSVFRPGDHPWVFGVDFGRRDRLDYRLAPRGGPNTRLRVDARSPRCAPDDQFLTCARQCEAALAAECSDGVATFEACEADCMFLSTQVFSACEPQYDAFLGCVAGLPADASNWFCFEGGVPQPLGCQQEFVDALIACGFF